MREGRTVQWIQPDDLDRVSSAAKAAPRQRMNHNLHRLEDSVQRMLNAMEPDTYVRPHRHLEPPKSETFVILRGRAAVLIFDDAGSVCEAEILSPRGRCIVDIPAGFWHALVALDPGTVLFESKDGPYIAASDKLFAPWAPAEGASEAQAYREWMRAQVRP